MLAITLLLAFGFPSVLPLFAASSDSEKSLPACCRRHGAHHCTMGSLPSGSPVLMGTPCPFYPAASTPVRIASALVMALEPRDVEFLHGILVPLPRVAFACTRNDSANLERGPPALT